MINKIPQKSKILIVTNPIILLFFTSFISKRKKWQLYILIHDVFPNNLISSGILSPRSCTFRIIGLIFERIYRQANEFIVIGRDMEILFKNKYSKIPVRVIENWADIENIQPIKFNVYNGNKDTEAKLSFLFAGNLGRVQGIDYLYQALRMSNKYSYNFTFLGEGVMKEWLAKRIREDKMSHIFLNAGRPREEQNIFLNNCDIGVVSLSRGMFGIGVPSKFYNLLAAGKPVFYIGDENTEIKLVLDQYKNGWFARAGDINDIYVKIKEICETDKDSILRMGEISREIAERIFAKDIILQKFDLVF